MLDIHIDGKTIGVHLDPNGNLYFSTCGGAVQVCVDRNDELILDDSFHEIIHDDEDTAPVLRGKIEDSGDLNDDKHYIEENGHTFIRYTGDDIELYDDDGIDEVEQYFVIYDKNIDSDVVPRKNGDILALYDTFIYDDIDKKPELIISSKINTENSIYRIVVFTSGKIYLRAMGESLEIQYKLVIENDKLILNK